MLTWLLCYPQQPRRHHRPTLLLVSLGPGCWSLSAILARNTANQSWDGYPQTERFHNQRLASHQTAVVTVITTAIKWLSWLFSPQPQNLVVLCFYIVLGTTMHEMSLVDIAEKNHRAENTKYIQGEKHKDCYMFMTMSERFSETIRCCDHFCSSFYNVSSSHEGSPSSDHFSEWPEANVDR